MYARWGAVVAALIAGCASKGDGSATGESAQTSADAIPSGKGVHVLQSGAPRSTKERDTLAMAVGADTVWVTAPGSIHRATPSYLAIVDDAQYVPEIAVADKSGLYWLDSKREQLMRSDLDGANAAKVDSWYWNPSLEKQLLLDNGKLLWRSQSFTSSTNALWETPTPSGSATEKSYGCADAERDGVIYCWKGRKHVDAIDPATGKMTPLGADGAAISGFATGENKSFVFATLVPKTETTVAAIEMFDVTNGQQKRITRGQGITWEDGIRAVAAFGTTAYFTHGAEIYAVSRLAPGAPKLVTQVMGSTEASVIFVDAVIATERQLYAHVVQRSANPDLPGAYARESIVMIDLSETGSTTPTTDAGSDASTPDSGSIFDPADAGSDASAPDAGLGDAGTTAPPVGAPDDSSSDGDNGDPEAYRPAPDLPKKESSTGGCQSAPGDVGGAGVFALLGLVALIRGASGRRTRPVDDRDRTATSCASPR